MNSGTVRNYPGGQKIGEFYRPLPWLIVLSLFSFNQFGVLDLLGVRAVVQGFMIPPVVILGFLLVFPHIRKLPQDKLIRYLFVMLIMFSAKQLEASMVWNIGFAIIVGAAILFCRSPFYERTFELLMVVLTVFSLMGMLQWVILQFYPDLVFDLAVFNGVYLNNTEATILTDSSSYGAPIFPAFRLLGLGTGELYEFGPLVLPRLRSFLHEPSLAVAYFALPGALALTYSGYLRKCGIVVLVFSLLTLAVSVLVLVPLAGLSFLVLKFRRGRYANLCIVAIAVTFYSAVYFLVPPFDTLATESGSAYFENSNFAASSEGLSDKALSNYKRLGFIAYGVSMALQHPIIGVVGIDLHAVLGMYLWSFVYGGIIGLVAVYVLFFRCFSLLRSAFQSTYGHGLSRWVPYVLICAIFIQAAIFNDYGFSVAYGLTMIALTYRRLEDVVRGTGNAGQIHARASE